MSRRAVVGAMGAVGAGGVLAGCGGAAASGRRARETRATVSVLPVPVTGGGLAFETVLSRRRSVRSFTDTTLTETEIGQLLWAAQGVTHDGDRRTAPSAGALYPLEVYVATTDVVLHYLPDGHRAERWPRTGARDALADVTPSRDAVAGAPAVFVIAEVVSRTEAKYGRRGRTYADVEVGHAAQNLVLQAVALGLGAVTIGALDADRVASVLGTADGELARYLVPIGHPAPSPR